MKSSTLSHVTLTGQSFGITKDVTYYTVFGIHAFSNMNAIINAFPPAYYMFLPTAAAFAVLSFGFNLLAKLNSKHREGVMSWVALGIQGLVSAGVAVGTIAVYVLSSFIGTLLFTISLGISALYQLGCAIQQLYRAFQSQGVTRQHHLHQALDHLLNFLSAAVISAGLMIAEVLGLTKIVNLVLFVINVPLLIRSIYLLVKSRLGDQSDADKSNEQNTMQCMDDTLASSVQMQSLPTQGQLMQPDHVPNHSIRFWKNEPATLMATAPAYTLP
jgi:hypothetical protein